MVYETWRADEVILERKKSSQSRDCHDLSHTCARVKCAHKMRNTAKTDKTEKCACDEVFCVQFLVIIVD